MDKILRKYLYCNREQALLESAQQDCLTCQWILYLNRKDITEMAVEMVGTSKRLKIYDARRCDLLKKLREKYA